MLAGIPLQSFYTIMFNRHVLALVIALLISSISVAQQSALVKGRLVNKETNEPANEVQVIIPELNMLSTTDADGQYNFSQVPYGGYSLIIRSYNIEGDTLSFVVDKEVVDNGDVYVVSNDAGTSMRSQVMPVIALEDGTSELNDDGVSSQGVSGLLTASQDPFLNTAAFVFGPYRFQPRGYDRNQQDVQINGIMMNDLETGDAYWNQWGGLNDVFRGRSNTYGLQPSEYAYGGVNGNVYFDAVASSQRKQTRVTYSLSNRNYRNRLMVTHSSGLNKKGWAYSLSASKRWAKEGYIPGTFYDGYSYYAAVSKELKKHSFHLTTFGAPTKRGKGYPHIQELYDLAGTHYYNRNWGYQGGEKRNARVANVFQPAFIFNYQYKPNDRLHWNTAIGYQFGKNKNSTFDWYNAQNPWPDYYRNLPSYYLNAPVPNETAAEAVKQSIQENPDLLQVNWDRIYNTNYSNFETLYNADGQQGNDINGRRSLYVLCNDVEEMKRLSFNTYGTYYVNEHINVNAGLNYIHQTTENYRELADLLGGDYYLNYNQFAERTYVGNKTLGQYDVENPNRAIRQGDKYRYDYITRYDKTWVWGQGIFTYNKFDFFIAGNLSLNSFSRKGLYRNGLFPDNSLGKSIVENFLTYSAKGGVTYKINGRNYIFVNAGYFTGAPTIENTYVAPRLRNTTVTNPVVQKTKSLEAGYYLKSPKFNGRLVGYVTDITDAVEIKRFYNDAPDYETFVNYVLQGVNTRFTGTEIALDVKVSPSLSVTGVAAIGQAFYTNNPLVSIYKDNDSTTLAGSKKVYVKNYYLGVGPQSAYTLGLNYSSKQYWYAHLNCSYFDRNYMDASVDRRSGEAVDLITPNSDRWNAILAQERVPSAFTVDMFVGKSFYLSKIFKQIPGRVFLYINVGVNNLLNNKNIITGGFEQLRYSFDQAGPAKFPNKYFYGYGTNYFINMSLKF